MRNPSSSGLPLVSIVIPVYNQGDWLAAAIDSALGQDYAPLELIVVDDGSTDATPDVIAGYGSRLVALRQANRGAAYALNAGIARARGDLICWLSADDEFLPGKIAAQVDAFGRDPAIGMTYTGYDVVDARGEVLRRVPRPRLRGGDPFLAVFWENPINGSTAMLRRAVFDQVGVFDTSLLADVDADMWLRVAGISRIVAIEGSYLRYRVHGASLSANRALMRESMTRVRLARLRDGSLLDRMGTRSPRQRADLLARIALDYAWRGYPELAGALLSVSRREGSAPRAQVAARVVLDLTRWRVAHRLGLRIGSGIRRRAWRLRERLRRPAL